MSSRCIVAALWASIIFAGFSASAFAANLTHRYPFDANARDVVGGAVINSGKVVLDGSSGYVNLPNNLVTNYNSITMEMWVTDYGSSAWARLFDFGNSSGGEDFPLGSSTSGLQYMFLTSPSGSGVLRGAYTVGSGEQGIDWTGNKLTVGLRKHVVWESDGDAQAAWLYVDGMLVGSNNYVTITPAALGPTVNDWIGRSQWHDPLFYGSFDEFRIYNGAIDPLQIAINDAAGPDTVVTNPGTLLAVNLHVSSTMIPGSAQSAGLTGDFSDITNVSLQSLSGVLYTSSDPSVVSVNPSGYITAVQSGTATVTANFEGVMDSQVIQVTAPPQTLIHRYSFSADASDSEDSANGTLSGGAAISNGVVSLNGSSAYVDLPNNLFTNLNSISFEAWFTDKGGNGWARLYDFGNSSGGEGKQGGGVSYMFMSIPAGFGGVRGSYNLGFGEQVLDIAARPSLNIEHHLVWTQDANSQTAKLYIDGALAGENDSFTFTPAAIGSTVNDWLGRSQYNDPYFYGTIDEFRIYSAALSPAEVTQNYQLGPDVSPQSGPVIVSGGPQDVAVNEQQPAIFSVNYYGRRPVQFQWFRNGQALAGETNDTYRLSNPLPPASGAVFSVALTNTVAGVNYSAVSANATLTVYPDTNPPTLSRALNIGITNVQVVFAKPVEAASATNTAHYVFTNGLAVTAATLASDHVTVTLTTAPLVYGSNYMILVSAVRDRAYTPNLIAPNSAVAFLASPLSSQDLGGALPAGCAVPTSDGFDVTAGGGDLGGVSDQVNFSFQIVSGDFDRQVRVAGLGSLDAWAKAALMARETLDTGSRMAAAVATPGLQGSYFEYRQIAYTKAVMTGSFPPNPQKQWLRLKRTGNLFTSYASYDGVMWTQLGSVTLALPSSIYFGLSVSSHRNGNAVTAQFRDLGPTVSTVVGMVDTGTEPLGPSSRRTPIAISEIMYKPAKRADARNTEFLELFNSNPWSEDIGGYTLAGQIAFTFPAYTSIPGNGFIVVAAVPSDLEYADGIGGVMGPYVGSLKTTGPIELLDENGALLLDVNYADTAPWPMGADGTGHSIVLARPSYGEADPHAWALSDGVGGSPGTFETYHPSPLRAVVINEILAHTDPPDYDAIELYNHGNTAVDLSGCTLSDEAATNRFTIPTNTVIPARGFLYFTQMQLGFRLNAAGESVYFKNPDGSRVLDALKFEAQRNGIACGRYPDGAAQWYPLMSKTLGTNNAAPLISPVGINEIMYHPISGQVEDEYVELYNHGTNAINLGGWKFVAGITYTIPTNTLIAPNGYLVVAENVAHLLANYPQLNSTNTVGGFSGKLSGKGERLALSLPGSIVDTNTGVNVTNYVDFIVDEVTYGTGGRWGRWSDGGGSSLELVNARSDKRLAANWADSDDSAKSVWTNIETTGVLDNGANYGSSISFAQIGLLDAGECLVDNIEVRPGTNGDNYVANPDFESGLGSWQLLGDHSRSSLEANAGYPSGGHALHLRTDDRIWTGGNSAQVELSNASLASGDTATLRFKARWLHGCPEVLLRLGGNWLEATGRLPIPANLGTPGLPNSRVATNAPPAIYEVTHTPALPAAGQAVVVTARVADPDGISSLKVSYRLDPATTYTEVAMADDGTGGDAIAKDGVYSATIPRQPAGATVAFYLTATDKAGASSRFPALVNDNGVTPECVVMFGDPNPPSTFGAYHYWLTQTNVNRWVALPILSNEEMDGTLVYGNRVIYNMKGRYGGSPYHQVFDSPAGNAACHYKWSMPKDDLLLGGTSFNKIAWPGNDIQDDNINQNVNDATLQREQAANMLLRSVGVPWVNRRYVAVYVNGHRRGALMEDALRPSVSAKDEYFPNDTGGSLYKLQPWFEFAASPSGNYLPFNNVRWNQLTQFTTAGGAQKMAAYRWNYEMRETPDSLNNYSNVFSLTLAATSSSANFVQLMESVADMENWMRLVAVNHAAGDWDCWGVQNGQNVYGWVSPQHRWTMFMFDLNIVLGNRITWGPGQNLLTNPGDTGWSKIYSTPEFMRMYWRALKELVNGGMTDSVMNPKLEAKYAAFVADGFNAQNPSAIETWVSQARGSIATQVAAVDAADFTLSAGSFQASSNAVTLSGTAPFEVTALMINGETFKPTWNSLTGWTMSVPASFGTNLWSITAHDRHGDLIGGTNTVTIKNASVPASPAGNIVFSEIMFNPAVPAAEFVELYNRSTNTTFDLSGWKVNGLSYTFPAGTLLAPNNYLVLTRSAVNFANACNSTCPVFAEFSGNLPPEGETLSLIQPGTTNVVIDRVRYETNSPWSSAALNPGASFQVIDPKQDTSRAGNWSVGQGNPVVTPQWVYVWTNMTATSSRFYIYLKSAGDIYVDDFKLVPGLVPETGGNLLTNGDFELPLSTGWNLTANFTSSAISSAQRHKGTNSLHVIATAAGSGGGNAIYQDTVSGLTVGAKYTLSFWYLQTTHGNPLITRLSSASIVPTFNPAPPSVVSTATASPGSASSTAATLPAFPPLWLNEVQPENLTGPTNALGGRGPWVELYNPGTNTVSLNGLYLGTNLSVATPWTFPATSSIAPGKFMTIWCDGQPQLSTPAELHTSFRLAPGTGSILLSRFVGSRLQVVDYLNYSALPANYSYGDLPDAQPFYRQPMYAITPGATNSAAQPAISVAINEWMAGNTNTIQDPLDNNKYDDWFELYNYGTNTVDLAGYYLTHSLTNETEFLIPSGYPIPPHGFLLVWADKKNTAGATDLHVNFKLSKSGASIGLYDAAGNAIDYVTFGEQVSDISEGRYPDGGATIYTLPHATPGINNVAPNTAPHVVSPGNQYLYFGQTLSFAVQATDADVPAQTLTYSLDPGAPANATIDAATGLFVWTPTAAQTPGTNAVTVRVTDDGVPPLSSAQTFTVTTLTPPVGTSDGISGHSLTLSWPTVPGKTYRIEYKNNLTDATWTQLGVEQTGTGAPVVLNVDLTATPERYYRVQVVN